MLVIEGCTVLFISMSTLPETEKFGSRFSAEHLAVLKQITGRRRQTEQAEKPCMRDTDRASVGTILKPIGTRDKRYSEMLEGRL